MDENEIKEMQINADNLAASGNKGAANSMNVLIAAYARLAKHVEKLEKFKDAIIRVHTSMNGDFGHFESVDEVIDELEKDEGRE